jgi:hypothetical protein
MNLRLFSGALALLLLVVACDNTTNNAPKNVVNQTTNTAPQVINNTTIINQAETRASATPQPAPAASKQPTASPAPQLQKCPGLNIDAAGNWNIPRPDKTPRILKPGEYQLFPDGSAKITKPGEPDVGQVLKPPTCASSAPVSSVNPVQPAGCKLPIDSAGNWNMPRPDKTPRILKPGEYQLFPDGSAKITKPGEPDTGSVVKPC